MAEKKFFYGWVIVAASVLGIASSFSLLVASMTGIYAEPLIKEFGWTTEQIFQGSFLAGIFSVVSAPLIGALSDRIGVRPVLAASFLFEVCILYSFSFMDGHIYGYLLRYMALALVCMGTTQVVFSRVLASWFSRRLGLALGIALAGVGVGGWFWSRTIQWLIDGYGWRGAYTGMALFIGCVTLPVVLLVIRDRPSSMGLSVDGDDNADVKQLHAAKEQQGMTLRQAAGTQQYWLMISVFMLVGLGLQGVSIHMVPLMKSQGLSAQLAASTQANMFLAVVAGRLSSGWLLDRVFAARIAQAFLVAPIIGISALLFGVSGVLAGAAAMCVGLAIGGESDVIAYLVKRHFGIKYYSRIYGTFFSAFGIAAAIAPLATAWGLEQFAGGYGTVLWAHVSLLILALLVLFWFQPYPKDTAAAH